MILYQLNAKGQMTIYCLKALVQYTYITSLNSSLTKLLYLKRHDSTLIHRL